MARPTVAEVDLRAFKNNWDLLKRIKNPKHLIPVIKADAYGHGAMVLASYLASWGAVQVAVAMVEEAVLLRKSGYAGKILILGPILNAFEVAELVALNLTPVVSDSEELQLLARESFGGALHLKWDTGMNRLGFLESEKEWVRQFLSTHPQLRVEALCTHFFNSGDYGLEDGHSTRQIQSFQKIETFFSEIVQRHIFNSEALFAHQALGAEDLWLPHHGNYGARPGLSLYGYCGVNSDESKRLQPVLTLKTKIVHIVSVPLGSSVSYNATWKASRDSRIAVLPIGYADGYPRSLSNKGQVFLHQQMVPLVGRVCMDYLMIDITDIPQARIGDEVELWGKNLSLESLAQSIGTITYELLTSITARVPRLCVNPVGVSNL